MPPLTLRPMQILAALLLAMTLAGQVAAQAASGGQQGSDARRASDDQRPPNGEGSTQKVETSLGLTIDVVALPKQIDLPGSFTVAFRLTNPTSGRMNLLDVDLRPVESPAPLDVAIQCREGHVTQRPVEPKNAVLVACELSTPDYGDSLFGFFRSLLSRWSLITMTPGDYQFVVMVVARGNGGDGQSTVVMTSKAFPVHLSPTVWQAVLGAMLGALLMVLFWASSPKVQGLLGEPEKTENSLKNLGAKFAKGVALWCGSTVAASIAIFLTFRLKDASMPFTISVNDFYGGLVIGLFGVVLTNTLAPKLFGTSDKTQGQGQAPGANK